MRLAGHVACMGEKRGCIGFYWGNWRERDHWGDLGIEGWNIRMDLQEVGFEYMDWIGPAQDRYRWWRIVGAGMNIWFP